MSGFDGDDFRERVRAASDILDVIQAFGVPLKKTGATHKACCPFHKEKTPSFVVSPQRQSFKCFGCGAGGDVFKFLMMREGLDFVGALHRLAERAGVPIPETTRGPSGPGREVKERLYELHVKARDWFHANLMRSKQAEVARRYLKERGFSGDTAKEFRLGFAPDSWDALIQWGTTQGAGIELLEQAGLVIQGERGAYDRFRGRLMIPIADEMGRVVGFSGRVLDAEAKEAKYVNSPETAIFRKGRLLFGLDRAKREMQESKVAVMCEGQLDWIRCWEAGVRNVVAPQGTAFTEDQARVLGRYAELVILCFDADAAGQKATWSNAAILIAAGLTTRAVRMPAGEDPDSFIRKHGGEAFRQILSQGVDVFEYKAAALARSLNMREPRNHQRVVEEMTPLLQLVESEIQRQRIIQNVCDILRMETSAFLMEYRKIHKRRQRPSPSDTPPSKPSGDAILQNQNYLLLLALTEAHAAKMLAEGLDPEWLEDYDLRTILLHVIQRARENRWKPGWEGIDLDLGDDDRKRIAWMLTHPIPMDHRAMATGLQDALSQLHKAHLGRAYRERMQQLQDPALKEEDRVRCQKVLLDLARKMKDV